MTSAASRFGKLFDLFGGRAGGPVIDLQLASDDIWCIRPGVTPASLAYGGDGRAEHMHGGEESGEPRHYRMLEGGIAEVSITGLMSKEVSWLRLFGLSCKPSIGELAAAVRQAGADSNAAGVMLYLDTPGGSIPVDLVDAVREVALLKPVHAYAAGLCCSAGYWPASQAARLTANRAAELGSIGTFAVLLDASKAAGMMGLRFHIVASGPYKGAAAEPGAGITPEQLEYFRERIGDQAALFVADIAAGRRLAPAAAEKLADGRAWIAARAVELGLCDGVETYQEALAALSAAIETGAQPRPVAVPAAPSDEPEFRATTTPPAAPEEDPMAQTTTAPPAAETAGTEERGLLDKIKALLGGTPAAAAPTPPAQAAAPALTAEDIDKRVAAAVETRLQEREVDGDLAALAGTVPPAVLASAETRAILIEAKAKGPARYAAALGLVKAADASALLGGPVATDQQAGEGVTGLGMSAAEIAACQAAGATVEDLKRITTKYNLRTPVN